MELGLEYYVICSLRSYNRMAGCFGRNEDVYVRPRENGFPGPAAALDRSGLHVP